MDKKNHSKTDANENFKISNMFDLTIKDVLAKIIEETENEFNPISIIAVVDQEGKERFLVLDNDKDLCTLRISISGHLVLTEKPSKLQNLLDAETTHKIAKSLLKRIKK